MGLKDAVRLAHRPELCRRAKYIMPILFLAIFLFSSPFAHSLERSEITFYAGFENTLTADIAKGKKEPIDAKSCKFAEGILGKGVITDERITFDYDKNINAKEATVSVWAKPLNWGSSDIKTGQYNFVYFHGSPAMQITTVYWGVTRFYLYYPGEKEATNIPQYGAFWEAGRWRNLVVTWKSEKEVQFFIDGVMIGRITENVVPIKNGINFSIGAPNMVFDELMVFKRALKHEEVRALFYGVKKDK